MTTKTLLVGSLLVAVPLLAPAQPPSPTRQEIVLAGQVDSMIRVRDVQIGDDEIGATIVNLTDDELRDIRLRVRDMFLWANERRPGVDDVSRAEEFVVKGPIPPRGALAVTAPRSPLPLRSDGDFRTTIEVTSLIRQPITAQAPPTVGSAVGTPPPAEVTPPPVRTVPPAGAPAVVAPPDAQY